MKNWPAQPCGINCVCGFTAISEQAIVYGSQGKLVFSVNPTTGEPNWTFPVRTRVESSPVIAGNAAFLATSRGRIHAVDLASGKETWQFEAGGGFTASPAISNGRIVIGNTDGALYCFGKRD